MSDFANNPFDLNDYHKQQAEHYGLKTYDDIKNKGGMKDPARTKESTPSPSRSPPRVTAAAGNANVQTGTSDSDMNGAYPTVRVQRKPVPPKKDEGPVPPQKLMAPEVERLQRIPRKPVGIKAAEKPLPDLPANEAAAESSTGPSRPSRVLTPDGKTINVIFTRTDGRFDPSTIRPESAARYTPPVSPVQPPAHLAMQVPIGRKRADTNTSNASRGSIHSITDTIKAAGRRMSDWMNHSNKLGSIVLMSQRDRDEWLTDRQREPSDDREKHRQTNPDARPDFQKEYLVNKNKKKNPRDSVAFAEMSGQHYQTMLDHSRSNDKLNRLDTDASVEKLPVADLTLTRAERDEAKLYAQAFHPSRFREELDEVKNVKTLTKGEKAAVFLSKVADPVKRSGTAESDKSFWCVGSTPTPMEMQNCRRCLRPAFEDLHDGLCDSCGAWVNKKGQ